MGSLGWILETCASLTDGRSRPPFLNHNQNDRRRTGRKGSPRRPCIRPASPRPTPTAPPTGPFEHKPKAPADRVELELELEDADLADLVRVIGEFTGKGPTPDEFKWGVDTMRTVAEHAAQAGVTIATEYLNRFENYFLTSVAQTVTFVQAVDHPNVRMMYDTFHANIEEKNLAAAIQAAAPWTVLVHISENDRSIPGTGHVHWDETFDALHTAGYDGWMVVEAFGLALPNIVAATKIWRKMFPSEDQLATDSLAFMKANVARRWR